MFFIGVDLAWGDRQPTGVAVLDHRGQLLHVSAAKSDDEITSALASYLLGGCLVAFDAPLIVANAQGNRPAEAALNRDFARFDAGAHPSNTTKPEFRNTPRAARLADLWGLDIDPESQATRRALEVYPHPATVSLFGLGRTLKYKNKPGRTLEQLRSEMLQLTRLLEGLAQAEPAMHLGDHDPWRSLVAGVEAATKKSELRRAEDQIDAVVCAYVAMFTSRRPELTTTYGDLATGYIVTPTLPTGQVPAPRTPRPTPVGGSVLRTAVTEYAIGHPQLREDTDQYVALVTTLLDDAGINYLSVTGRAKSVASFAAKAARTLDGKPIFADPLHDIPDQIGLRVITYLHRDVAAVADVLRDQFSVIDDRDMGEETAMQGRFGYASRHLLVTLDPARDAAPVAERLRERTAQVQVRTVLQHAWAEFEHATRYKGTIPEEHAPDLDRRFTLAAGLLELADREFAAIHERLQATGPEPLPLTDADDPRLSAQDLATFLAGQYVDAGWSRPDHYQWVSGLLLELGITSLEELAGLLSSVDTDAINGRMEYRYPPGAVRRLDDALLAVFGTRYLNLHGNAHRVDSLRLRLEKLRAPLPS